MTEVVIIILDCKHKKLKAQITKISKSVNKSTLDGAELKAHVQLILKVQVKLDSLKKKY